MMLLHLSIAVGVLLAAPLLSQTLDPVVHNGEVTWWSLNETPADVNAALGAPSQVTDFDGYLSWQHRLPGVDHESDVSSQMVFRRSTGRLISVTRTYESDRDVSAFFPPAESSLHAFPDAKHATFRALVRRLPGSRILIASGLASGPGQFSAQLVLLREEELTHFFPWIAESLSAIKPGAGVTLPIPTPPW